VTEIGYAGSAQRRSIFPGNFVLARAPSGNFCLARCTLRLCKVNVYAVACLAWRLLGFGHSVRSCDVARMTPAERMHAQMLAQLGLTEDQFKAMDPAAQQKIEDKIRDMIKQQAANSPEKRTGIITDKSA
jgi:hypothetical protein